MYKNGIWQYKFLNPDTGAGGEGEALTPDANLNEGVNEAEVNTDSNAEIARLKAELAKAKAATDKATKEAGDIRKQLRAKQSAEEIAAEEKKTADEALQKELDELRRKVARAETVKSIMGKLGTDETVSGKMAEYLYGAEDVDAALTELSKLWGAREKAIRLEFGKVSKPGIGAGDGVSITEEQLDAMTYMERVKFKQEHPEEYERLMGRT